MNTRNTLSNIESNKTRIYGIENVLKALYSLQETKRYTYVKAAISLPSVDAIEADIEATLSKGREVLAEVEVAIKEWEIADSFAEIYEIEAFVIYEKLTGKALENHLFRNTLKGVKKAEQSNSQSFGNWQEKSRELRAYEYATKDEFSGGFDPHSGALDRAVNAAEEAHRKASSLSQAARAEWEAVKRAIKQKDMSAGEYLALIKEIAKV